MSFRTTFLTAAVVLLTASVVSLRNTTQPKGWFVPTVDGKFFWVSREKFESENSNIDNLKTVLVEYFLFTKENPTSGQQMFLDDDAALVHSHFNKDKPTRFIIHGWINNMDSAVNTKIRQAFMEDGDFNVISVDWSSAAGSLNYISAKRSVPTVGKNVAAFIDFLNEKAGMSFDTLALVGHSLGAHVCGYAGKNVNRGMISAITGLDPALPLFDYSNCDTRLCTTDALFVDSIQTNGDLLGFLEPIGTVAYYPNGGKKQPGCFLDFAGSCAHKRSFLYYAEAVLEKNFVAIKCDNYEAAVNGNCEGVERTAKMGSANNEGCYFVPVNKKSLFGTGRKSNTI